MISQEKIAYTADQCLMLYGGGRITVDGAQRAEIEGWVVPALSEVGTFEYWTHFKAENQSTVGDAWVVPFKLPITVDPVTGDKQIIFTESPLVLPKNRGVIFVSSVDGNTVYDPTTQEKWFALKHSSLYKDFIQGPFYSQKPGGAYLYPTCDNEIEDTEAIARLAVANDATFTDGQVLMVYQRLRPQFQVRFGILPDMITDQNPKNPRQ